MGFSNQMRVVVVACAVIAVGAARLVAAPADGHEDGHPTEGPHHGTLVELGREDYHAELVHDEKTDTLTIYILDAAATAAVPIPAQQLVLNMRVAGKPRQFRLTARPQAGDAAGSSSAFAVADRELCEVLDAPDASGRLNVEIGGKVYVGTVGGHAHAHAP